MLPELPPDTQNAVAKFKKIKADTLSNTEKVVKKQLDMVSGSIFEIAKQIAQMENARTRLEGSYIGLSKTVEAMMEDKEEKNNATNNINDSADNPGSDGTE